MNKTYDDSLATLKDYIDYQLKCCDAVIERLKLHVDFFSNDKYDQEWNSTITRKNCLWEIKVQVDNLLWEEFDAAIPRHIYPSITAAHK